MEDRPVVLGDIPLARGALEWAPGPAIGIAIGAQIAPPEPAAIATASMGAEVLRGIYGGRPSEARGHRLGGRRGGLVGVGGFWLPPGASRSLGLGGQRVVVLGAL